jgi:hypothetical protein
LYEKRRRRRESHNAVERRRRDAINERIGELGSLLPYSIMDEDSKQKASKGCILAKSVEFIRRAQYALQDSIERQERLESALEQMGVDIGSCHLKETLKSLLAPPEAARSSANGNEQGDQISLYDSDFSEALQLQHGITILPQQNLKPNSHTERSTV